MKQFVKNMYNKSKIFKRKVYGNNSFLVFNVLIINVIHNYININKFLFEINMKDDCGLHLLLTFLIINNKFKK